jgi:uncharacterized radical SAM protein YgiQ
VRGTAISCKDGDAPYIGIPSYEEVSASKEKFSEAFRLAYLQQNPWSAQTVVQQHGKRALVCLPPALPLTEAEMDAIYALPFEKSPHPSYLETIPAWEQIKTSITSHRGCFGGCAFCAITMHQGKTIQSRSQRSILAEISALAKKPWFRGTVSDIGGPTANMFGLGCDDQDVMKKCRRESCLFPNICPNLRTGDKPAMALLKAARSLAGIKHTTVSSGVRYDLLERQPAYFRELIEYHVSGLLKVAPEHLVNHVTDTMRKPGRKSFEVFLANFRTENSRLGKRQYVVPYLISGHPGCTLADMLELALILKEMGMKVEQVQDFTPTPGTIATCMFYCGIDPMTGKQVYTAKSDHDKGLQKSLLLWHLPSERIKVMEALKELGREGEAELLWGHGAGVYRQATNKSIKKAR